MRLSIGAVYLIAVAVLAFSGCGSDTKGSGGNNGTDTDMSGMADMSVDQSEAPGDLGTDATQFAPDCDGPIFDGVIDIDSAGESGQFYSSIAFDGGGVWVVYNRPESATVRDEAMFVARVLCDGTMDVGPIQVSEPASGRRNYHPAIVAYGGSVHVVWVSQPTSGNAKRVMYTQFRSDGTPALLEPANITPIAGVDALSETIWEIDLAAYEGGGVIVGTALGPESQVVGQRFTSDGLLDGSGFFVFPNKGIDQAMPTVAARPDGELFVSWTRSSEADPQNGIPEDPGHTVYVSVPAGASEALQNAPFPTLALSDPNPMAAYAKTPGPNGEMFLAFQIANTSSATINVRDGSTFESARQTTVGTAGYNNFRPRVAGSPSGGAVAWYRWNSSPIRSELMIQPFSLDDAGVFTNGAETALPSDSPAIPPYGPGLAHVREQTYAVSWSEGASAPESRVRLRMVTLR